MGQPANRPTCQPASSQSPGTPRPTRRATASPQSAMPEQPAPEQPAPEQHMKFLLFSEVAEEDLPTQAQIQALARQFHCRPQQVQVKVCLLAPECRLAKEYCRQFEQLPDFAKVDLVPPVVVSAAEYAVKTGHRGDKNGIAEATLKFAEGFKLKYRPIFVGTYADPPLRTARQRPNE